MSSDKKGKKEEFPSPRPPERPSLAEICLPREPKSVYRRPSQDELLIDDKLEL